MWRRWSACAVPGQPAVGASEADPVFSGQLPEAAALLEVLGDEPEAALLRQSGIGMAMHGGVRPGLVGRTQPVASSHPLVNEQPAETKHLGLTERLVITYLRR
jgi:hypothetical protein